MPRQKQSKNVSASYAVKGKHSLRPRLGWFGNAETIPMLFVAEARVNVLEDTIEKGRQRKARLEVLMRETSSKMLPVQCQILLQRE